MPRKFPHTLYYLNKQFLGAKRPLHIPQSVSPPVTTSLPPSELTSNIASRITYWVPKHCMPFSGCSLQAEDLSKCGEVNMGLLKGNWG